VRKAPQKPCSDQAESARRPLRRRPATIARPARVRMRRRKPCTRARRRLFGWKVRLPLATAFSCHVRPAHASPARRSGVVLLLAGAVPKRFHPGSQPYRRLSGDCSRVLTGFRWVKPGQILADHGRRKLACPNAPDGTCRGKQSAPTRPTAAIFAVTENDRKTTDPNATELLAAGRKTVSFSQCRFRQERWSRRSEDGGSTSCLDDPRVVSSTEIASCCQEASAH
jgi:hypothetical protein